MKIMIVCSTSFYDKVDDIAKTLRKNGHEVIMPNCFDEPVTSEDNQKRTDEDYFSFFKEMYVESREKIASIDAILVLNYTKVKNGKEFKNYVGASTFLEIYEAFMQSKKIYMVNDIPEGMLYDDLKGMNPTVVHEEFDKIK